MASIRRFHVSAALLLTGGLLAPTTQAQWTAVLLHPAGAYQSEGRKVGDGQQVGYQNFGDGVFHATLWAGSAASAVDLTPAGATYSDTRGVGNGQQVGVAQFGGLARAMLWSGSAASAIDLTPAGATSATAFAIDGNTQAGTTMFAGSQAGLWTGSAASWVSLHPGPPYFGSEVLAAQGGHQVGSANSRAAMWSGSAGSFVDLAPLSVNGSSSAVGVWGDQQVGNVEYSFKPHAALWSGSEASYVDLHPAGKTYSYATAVSHGVQVGYTSNGLVHAALWTGTAASYVDLHPFLPAAYGGSVAYGIWHDGSGRPYVIGTASNTAGNGNEAVMWVGEPASAWSDQGSALAGVSGDPLLVGTGTLAAGSSNAVDLTNAAPSAIAGLFLALSSTPTPFKGGTLLASPPAIGVQIFNTSAGGAIPLAFVMPAGATPGSQLWLQWAIQDAAAIHGVSLSNAIRGVAP